jgi:APA family basic amino acid/polyamine antiporter
LFTDPAILLPRHVDRNAHLEVTLPADEPSSTKPDAHSKSPAAGIGVTTGTLLIVANMIGVGVFTTTGFMAGALGSPVAILVAWVIGGVAAFCGALAYAELGAALPRNGGEYQLLSRIYHPAFGFTAGWISLIVGFAAPLAAFAMAFGKYVQVLFPPNRSPVSPLTAGLILIGVLAMLHSVHVGRASWTHNALTFGKVGLIAAFIVAGLVNGELSRAVAPGEHSLGEALFSPMFAVQLVYVSFAYTGWNTAAYLAGEFRRPARDVPLAILMGTAIVAVLYLGLNAVFLAAAPLAELKNKEEIAHVAAASLFGPGAGRLISIMIALGLISAASANTMAGPRVYEAMGYDFPLLRFLKIRRAGGGPFVAIAMQAVLAAIMLHTSSFDSLLRYIGVTLSLVAAMAVIGVIVLRFREPRLVRPYRTWGYPITPLVFLVLELWMVFFAVRKDIFAIQAKLASGSAWPETAWFIVRQPVIVSLATLAVGFALYFLVRPRRP